MNNRVFVDADIILDALMKREPFVKSAAQLFELANSKKIRLFTSAVVLANVFYISRKTGGSEQARKQLRDLRFIVNVLPLDEKILDAALNSAFSDFEDGLQYFAARENTIPVIITRNTKHYQHAKDTAIQTAAEFLSAIV